MPFLYIYKLEHNKMKERKNGNEKKGKHLTRTVHFYWWPQYTKKNMLRSCFLCNAKMESCAAGMHNFFKFFFAQCKWDEKSII